MKKLSIILFGVLSTSLLTACTENKGSETTSTSTIVTSQTSTEEKKTDSVLKEKNYNGQMGKGFFTFSFTDNTHYIEKYVYPGISYSDVHLIEGTYKIENDEVMLEPNKNIAYKQYIGSDEKEAYQLEDGISLEPFARLFVEKNGALLITYSLDKEKIDQASDDTYGKLSNIKTTLSNIDTTKEDLVIVKDTSQLFQTEDDFHSWVLQHISTSGYSIRNTQSNTEMEDGTTLRYLLNAYLTSFETSPGSTIGIDTKGNMYNDTPSDGQPREFRPSESWDAILDKDITAGKVVISEENKGFEKLNSMKGVWAIVPGDSGFTILDNREIEFMNGPGMPIETKKIVEASFDESTGILKFTIDGTNEPTIIKNISDDSLDLNGRIYTKIE